MSTQVGFGELADTLQAMPAWVLLALAVVMLLQVGLAVWALIDLLRLPENRVAGGRKWVWLLIILLVNLIGPIVYFVAGKKPATTVEDGDRAAASERARGAVDLLYGDAQPHPEATPEALAGDPAIGTDGTGAGELL